MLFSVLCRLLAVGYPTIDLRQTKSMQNLPAMSSQKSPQKHDRATSSGPPGPFIDFEKPLQKSKFKHSKTLRRAETARRSCPGLSLQALQPVSKDKLATDFIREALQIQRDANALASSAMAASTRPDVNQKEIRETIRSANMIASLAREKSQKSRDLMEKMLGDLSTSDEAAATAQLLKETGADADDTAHSSCQSTQKLNEFPDAHSPQDCGTSAEVPALAGTSGNPEQLSEDLEYEVQDDHCRNYAAFSRANIFERFGLDERVSLVDEVDDDDELSDGDVLNRGYRGDFGFIHR